MSLKQSNISNEIFSTNIFKQAPVAIVIFRGENFLIEFANDFYLQILGKSSHIIGKPLFESFPELKSQGLKEILDGIMQTGIPYNINDHEFLVERNNKKEQLFFNCAYQPLRENNNIISGVIVVFSEVTQQFLARKLAENNEKRFSSVFMKSPFAFAIMRGKNMVVALANESIKEIWGKGDDVIGKRLFEILPEVIDQGFPEIINTVYTTGIPYYGYEMLVSMRRNKKLEECYFNFVYQPYREDDDTISGIVLIAYEVTEQVLVKKAVAESEEKYRLMTDLMPVKVSFGDNDGNTNYFNERWIDYTGFSLKELVAFGWDKIVHPDDKKQVKKKWDYALKNETNFEMEVRILDKNKKYHWHLSRVKPIKESNGAISHWIGINTEIHNQKTQNEDLEEAIKQRTQELTVANKELLFQNVEKQNRADELDIANIELAHQQTEKQNRADELEIANVELDFQKNLAQQQIYSRSLIEASRDPLFTISPQGKITDVNKASARVTGVTQNDLIGSLFFDYFTEPEKAKNGYEEVFTKGFVIDYPLTIKDHKLTDVLFNGSVYKDENNVVIGAVVVARDITQQKALEKELIEAKVFAEMATTIAEEATNKAEESVKSKQQFLSNMSHEIRTPMNAIIGFTKVVLKTELTAKQKEYLMAIKMSGDALIVLINDILDLAKVDAGKMTFEKTPFKLKLSLKAMLHLFETKIQEKNLKLVTHYDKNIPEVLVGDPVRLNQIILNLVSNAVKFTNKGKITVNVKLVFENVDTVTIKFSVADTGIGIKDTKTDKIFENFQQATSGTSRLFGGTGLGLAIVKQLVEGQKGKIEVESEINKGSTFSFILDFKKTNNEAVLEPEIMELNSDIKDIKILVVEDMELNQLLMKTLLDDFGFECEIAGNGKIALEKLQTKTFDIILMDLQMPEMNGFEATEYIRQTLKLDIPIIALTADVTTVDVAKCKEVGMNDYISKPVDERLLYSKLIGTIKKPVVVIEHIKGQNPEKDTVKYADMSYLLKLTKSNPKLMTEMIGVYLKQTPPLVRSMKQSYIDKDWQLLQATVHKMIPSFSIMGMSPEIAKVAHKIQEFANNLELSEDLDKLINELENACIKSFSELEIELFNLKK